jgi:hypothetical protein
VFYIIHIPDDGESSQPKSFPGILTIREGVDNGVVIDGELKHLFKGRYGWTIKTLSEDEFMINFPSEDMRNELTKFKGYEFATSYIKAKVEPTEKEKEVVSLLEETWAKATGFPSKSSKAEIIKEIFHLVGDPLEVDEKKLKFEGVVRVRALCKDAKN